MHIIFGKNTDLDEKYTLLELDTIRIGKDGPELTAYCVLENIPLEEMPAVEMFKAFHTKLLQEYKKQNWNTCENLIAQLRGKWGGEADSFYSELAVRINNLKTQTLDDGWTGIIEKN
jgi:hypothetical protein